MNAIANISSLPLPTMPKVAAAPAGGNAPALPVPHPVQESKVAQPEVMDAKVVEQQHFSAVQKAAEQIANVRILGDSSFTIFKDATGQYITRFRKNGTNQFTYIPEPKLFKISGATLVNTKA